MTIPESGSKRKLLDAAELLFAEKGFEAVSVRDITQLAKANVAAVNYHFGSRDNLLALVMMRYMTPVTEERIARLDALEKSWGEKPIPVEDLIEALVRPLVGQVKKSELTERLFYKLTGRICAEQGTGLPLQIEDQFRQVGDRLSRAFAKSLPSIPPEELAWRIHFLIGGMIHMLTHQDLLLRVSGGTSGAPTMEVTLARFIRFAAAGLREGTVVDEFETVVTKAEPVIEIPEVVEEVPVAEISEMHIEETEEVAPEPEFEEPEVEEVIYEPEIEEPEVVEEVLEVEIEEPVMEEENPESEPELEVSEAEEPEVVFEGSEPEPDQSRVVENGSDTPVVKRSRVVEKPVKSSPQITFDF